MAKVTDMIGDYAEPRGSLGYSVDYITAAKIANEMRVIMNMDLEESDIAVQVCIYNQELNTKGADEFIAAWELLNAGERRAWREFVRIGKC